MLTLSVTPLSNGTKANFVKPSFKASIVYSRGARELLHNELSYTLDAMHPVRRIAKSLVFQEYKKAFQELTADIPGKVRIFKRGEDVGLTYIADDKRYTRFPIAKNKATNLDYICQLSSSRHSINLNS